MTHSQDRLQELYEIALAIGPKADLSETVRNALATYLKALDCSAGAVLERREEHDDAYSYDPIAMLPSQSAVTDACQVAREWVADREPSIADSLPTRLVLDDDTAHVMALPEFGVLVLVTTDDTLDDETLAALAPLNEKLATACQQKRVETQLREDRDRFEAVFETIPEPIANVVYEDGNPVVNRVNAAFEATFGDDEETAVGTHLDELRGGDPEAAVPEPELCEGDGAGDAGVTSAVQRETTDGVGDFLVRSAPVESTPERTELFGLYVDVTAEKTRQRRLEQLSAATQDLLAETEQHAICDRAVEAAETILELSFAELSLHDRATDTLVPIARTNNVTDSQEEPTVYADRSSDIWQAYQSDEPTTIEATTAFDRQLASETSVESVVVFPLGQHGIFSIAPGELCDTSTQSIAGLLATVIETALDRAIRERGLERIQETTWTAVAAETHRDVADATVSHLSAALDFPFSTIWKYDDREHALVPVASTTASLALFDDIPTVRPGEGIVWDVFQAEETRVVDDISSDPDAYNPESAVASEIIVPIGDYGVLATGSRLVANFSPTERHLVEILAANLETAMELVDRRQELEVLDQVLARILRHNIRNDLTVIRGHAAAIAADCDGEAERAAETILRKSDGLESTAEHAREMRAVVAQRGEQAPLSLRNAALNAIAAVESEYPDAAIETTFAVSPQVTAHPQFEMAIRHLLENAVEHGSTSPDSHTRQDAVEHGSTNSQPRTDEGADHSSEAEPQVMVSIEETADGTALKIEDSGPGIDPMEVDVLERHGETALRHGSGSGLWIADRIVDYSDAMLGFVTSDRGTTVTITFD